MKGRAGKKGMAGKGGKAGKWEIQLEALHSLPLRSLPLRSLLPLRSHSHSHQTIATCARAAARYLVPSPSLYLVRESRRLKIPANLYIRFTRWRASTIYTPLTAQAAKMSTNSMLKVPAAMIESMNTLRGVFDAPFKAPRDLMHTWLLH